MAGRGRSRKKLYFTAFSLTVLVTSSLAALTGTLLAASPLEPASLEVGPLNTAHLHADFKLYILGEPFDFSQPRYQARSPLVHLEEGVGTLIHTHAVGVKLKHFFDSLGMKLSKGCLVLDDGRRYCDEGERTLKVFVNGRPALEFEEYLIKDQDKILISYGDEDEEGIREQLASLTNLAAKRRMRAEGFLAPEFSLISLEGRSFTLSELLGEEKPVVLWFMASWCASCAAQARLLKALSQALGERVTIVVIDLWTAASIADNSLPADDEEVLKAFRDLYGERDWIWALDEAGIAMSYGITSVDSTVVIATDGRIALYNPGPAHFDLLVRVLLSLLR